MDSFYIASLSGLVAGYIGKTLCYPIDTIKAQMYVDRSKIIIFNFKDLKEVITTTYQNGGLRGFYKGGLIGILGTGPAFSVYMTAYEQSKKFIGGKIKSKFLLHMTCGMTAEVVSCLLWLPIDVTKERMQVQKRLGIYSYSGSIDAIRQIIRKEGISGLYRAFWATLGFFGPYSALYFGFFEFYKSKSTLVTSNTVMQSTLGALAGSISAAILTHPLAISKVRLQVQAVKGVHEEKTFIYKNQLHAIQQIYLQEGSKALFRGFTMRMLYVGSLSTFNMTAYAAIKQQLIEILK